MTWIFFINPRRCRWAGLFCPYRAKRPLRSPVNDDMDFFLLTQGVAVGLGYFALTGRKDPCGRP